MEYCVFSKTKWNVIFFSQERWGMSLSSFPIQTTYTMASKMNGTGSFLGRRGETEREREDPSSLRPVPAGLAPHCCLPHLLALEPPIARTTPAANWGYDPFPDPPWGHRKIKPQSHLTHPSVSKKHSIKHENFAPRSPFMFLVQGLVSFPNASLV